MRTISKYILVLGIIGVTFVAGANVMHAQEVDYKLLAPLPLADTAAGQVTDNITPSAYVKGVVNLAIGVAGVLAVLMIIIAGFKYVTVETVYGKSSAKEDIKNALIGLFLAIAAYTILTLINPTLTNLTFSITPVKESSGLNPNGYCAGKMETRDGKEVCVEPIKEGETCRGTVQEGQCITDPRTTTFDESAFKGTKDSNYFGKPWANNDTYESMGDGVTDQSARTLFENMKVGINNQNCAFIGSVSCTSLTGIGNKAVRAIEVLKANCPDCTIVITGGTEYWLHGNRDTNLARTISDGNTRHYPGGNVMDLRLSSELQAFLEKNATKDTGNECVKNANSYARYRYKGDLYIDENIKGNPRHFHVCFY